VRVGVPTILTASVAVACGESIRREYDAQMVGLEWLEIIRRDGWGMLVRICALKKMSCELAETPREACGSSSLHTRSTRGQLLLRATHTC
jgi:hypothetical protein